MRTMPVAGFHSFNPRAHTRRDKFAVRADVRAVEVSTHAPTRGATSTALPKPASCVFQPTRPHEARRRARALLGPAQLVSTHAPTRGATLFPLQVGHLLLGVSTHAPTRGATGAVGKCLRVARVSTHAPTRGATRRWQGLRSDRSCFNPRAHTRRDSPFLALRRQIAMFQPTRPHEARPILQRLMLAATAFQPTRPHEARHAVDRELTQKTMFQPTRPHEARRAPLRVQTGLRSCFNPRAHTRRDQPYDAYLGPMKMFQPTRPHEARLML